MNKDRVSNNSYSNQLIFWLNGERVEISNPNPTMLLAHYLHTVGLTGTKIACGRGGCGACTVMLSSKNLSTDEPVHRAINACIYPLCAVDGTMVTTIEGIGNVHQGLDKAQYCIAKNNGSQCGFCTPGFVMNTHAYMQQHPAATQEELENIYGGNLCRCTGYRPILAGVRTLASNYQVENDKSQKCLIDPCFEVHCNSEFKHIDLKLLPDFTSPPRLLHFSGHGCEWFRPNTLEEVMRIKKQLVKAHGRDSVKLIVGNTASSIYPNEKSPYLIDISCIQALNQLVQNEMGITVGAVTPIQMLLEFAANVATEVGSEKGHGFESLVYHGQFIAGLQIRSAGSVAGNIFMTRDHAARGEAFLSDLFTVLSVLGTQITIASFQYEKGRKQFDLIDMPATEVLPEDAVIVCFDIPYTRKTEYLQTYRIARRLQLAQPIVNAGFRVSLDEENRIKPNEITLVYGGLDTMVRRCYKTEQFLQHKKWNAETLRLALPVLKKEVLNFTVSMEKEGITTQYRLQLAETFFYKFFLHVALKRNPEDVKSEYISAANHDIRPLSTGTQEYFEYPEMYPLTKPFIKRTAFVQATGEIKYTQDIALPMRGLHGAMVFSSRPHAKFAFTKKTAGLAALKELLKEKFPGFKDLVTSADIPQGGSNMIGLRDDDPVFSDGLVTSVGAPIGMVLAETFPLAKIVVQFISDECIDYEDLPAVTTLADAIKQNTVMPMIVTSINPEDDIHQQISTIERLGSNQEWLKDPSKPLPNTMVVRGTLKTPPVAHFYLETQCALAIPGIYDQITVYSSTQSPNGTQNSVAQALGIHLNQVSIIIEQIGGGFGGKQHRANFVAAQAAVAAHACKGPVRLLYDRATDMQMIGKHHPYEGEYYVAFTDDGKIEAMRLDFKSEAGDSYDCSLAVMEMSLLMADGCYMVNTLQANGTCYRTNKTSNTAYRTFGVVQMWSILESAIERVAFELSKKHGRKILPEEIREKNMYRNGTPESYDTTHFGQELDFCNIREIWDALKQSSNFIEREHAVQIFNRQNRWRKRGIVMMPQKHGVAFTEPRGSLNSSTAIVSVNMADGSVIIHHGAVEMGQGVHTKLAQLAANTLGIPLEWIRVGGNNSDFITNAPPTAAQTGFDLNGGAIEKACLALRARLQEFCATMEQYLPNERIENWRTHWAEKWKEIVFKAWFHRINLTEAESYKFPHYKGATYQNPQGKPFLYFSFGAAVTEVEIDVLSGEFKIIRADVTCDGCKTPNPALDIGQIEGGFVQGVGMATTEELIYNHDGRLITDNILNYKPPCTKTIPIDFRTRLHPVNPERNAKEHLAEKQAVKSTKAFTESTLTLGVSVYFALIHAILDARKELTGKDDWIDAKLPLTCQRIQQLCGITTDSLTF